MIALMIIMKFNVDIDDTKMMMMTTMMTFIISIFFNENNHHDDDRRPAGLGDPDGGQPGVPGQVRPLAGLPHLRRGAGGGGMPRRLHEVLCGARWRHAATTAQ